MVYLDKSCLWLQHCTSRRTHPFSSCTSKCPWVRHLRAHSGCSSLHPLTPDTRRQKWLKYSSPLSAGRSDWRFYFFGCGWVWRWLRMCLSGTFCWRWLIIAFLHHISFQWFTYRKCEGWKHRGQRWSSSHGWMTSGLSQIIVHYISYNIKNVQYLYFILLLIENHESIQYENIFIFKDVDRGLFENDAFSVD